MESEEAISTFAGITGASPEVAQGFLNMTGNNVERAIELFFENPELASNVQTGIAGGNTPAPAPAPAAAPSRPHIGRRDSSGIIHIDSDDDEVMHIDDSDNDEDDGTVAAAQAAAMAQEEEDAAMAKRLQEELYSGPGSGAGDDVRAPIARTTETLVAPNSSWAPEEDFESTILNQIRQQRRRAPRKYLFHTVSIS